jgi:hypothetical protein
MSVLDDARDPVFPLRRVLVTFASGEANYGMVVVGPGWEPDVVGQAALRSLHALAPIRAEAAWISGSPPRFEDHRLGFAFTAPPGDAWLLREATPPALAPTHSMIDVIGPRTEVVAMAAYTGAEAEGGVERALAEARRLLAGRLPSGARAQDGEDRLGGLRARRSTWRADDFRADFLAASRGPILYAVFVVRRGDAASRSPDDLLARFEVLP